MMKPSKKVVSIMIISGAITIAFIAADKIKTYDLNKKNNPDSESIFKSDTPVRSLEDFIMQEFEDDSVSNTNNDNSPKTVTEFALVELLANYKNLKDQSINSSENVENLTDALADQTKQLTTIPTKYSILDLDTFPDYEKENIKNYGNYFAKTLEIYFKEGALVNDADALTFVKKYAEIQANYAQALSELRVPRSISDEHLDFTNNIYKISLALPELATIDDDPLLYTLILEQYKTALKENSEILKKISDYFELNGIIYSDDEPGAMWNNY